MEPVFHEGLHESARVFFGRQGEGRADQKGKSFLFEGNAGRRCGVVLADQDKGGDAHLRDRAVRLEDITGDFTAFINKNIVKQQPFCGRKGERTKAQFSLTVFFKFSLNIFFKLLKRHGTIFRMVSRAQKEFSQKNTGKQRKKGLKSFPFLQGEEEGENGIPSQESLFSLPDDIPDEYIRETGEEEDGSSVYEIGPPSGESPPDDFNENLATQLRDEALDRIASFLLEAIDEDLASRKEWMDSVEKARQYLGFSIEDSKDVPFKGATNTFDTTLSTALVRFYAIMRAEFFPPQGPAHIQGSDDSSAEEEAQGERAKKWMNHYLTVEDKGYYGDVNRALLYEGFYGSLVKKVYWDEQKGMPLSRFIVPKDFIVDNDCLNILESERLTHVLHLSKRDILRHQKTGYYREVELPYLKSGQTPQEEKEDDKDPHNPVDLEAYTRRSLFDFYEVHTYVSLEEFVSPGNETEKPEIPLPYIVTVCSHSRKIVRLTRNWKEDDPSCQKINYFIQYTYLPGFGIYGLGLAHLVGTNAITLTKLLRQLVDAGSFKNLPGGLRRKGFKQQQNDLIISPGQFVEVDTGSGPLQEAFMPLPYGEPSQSLRELRQEIMEQTKELAATSEMSVTDDHPNAPVGTTLALLEVTQRIQSAVFQSFYFSLGQELQALYKLFQQNLGIKEFRIKGKTEQVSGEDFADHFEVTPVADPSLDSKTQRIARAETLLKVAHESPDLYNMREVNRRFCEAIGIQKVDQVLKPEEGEIPPADPLTENVQAMKGMPLKVYPWQDDDAHMVTHGPFAEENPEIKAHIQDHRASKYLKEMQREMGIELPPLEQMQDNPELQNHIALMAAQATLQSPPDTGAAPKPVDPNAVMMADIQQKAAETQARERIANLKAETDVFRAQLDFEKEKAKIESSEEIAELKAETDLEKEGMKHDNALQRQTGGLPGTT